MCGYLDDENSHDIETKKYTLDLLAFCKQIGPYVAYYKRQIKSYNDTAHNILKNEIDLIYHNYQQNKSVVLLPHWFQAS